jgi:hypothetical protein
MLIHPAQLGDLPPAVTRPPEHLDLVPLRHVDHPFPRHVGSRRLCSPKSARALRGGQNFRKGSGQDFRNPHEVARRNLADVLRHRQEE